MHGANLIRALRAVDPLISCEGLGGRHMADAGMDLRVDLAGNAIMGFAEVVKSFGFIRRVFLDTVEHLRRTKPDVLVLIDYPGFNIRLAQRAKQMGIPVAYYISPQVWAWKRGRIHTIARCVDKMLVILPFEEPLYRELGVDCRYVGHPLLDQIAATPPTGLFRDPRVIGLLPGSREQEIRRLLPVMIEVANGIRLEYPDARFLAPCVSAARENQVRTLAGAFPVETCVGQTYEVLDAARFCLVVSGTATLETALFLTPMAILYKTAAINYWLARHWVHIKHIGLVNILAGREIVPEFVQHDAQAEKMIPAALDLTDDTPARARMLEDLTELKSTLGGPGASARTAAEILSLIGRR